MTKLLRGATPLPSNNPRYRLFRKDGTSSAAIDDFFSVNPKRVYAGDPKDKTPVIRYRIFFNT